jgi:hypothetical protein
MALPLIVALTRAARIAMPFIERGVAEGLSSRSIERAIRAGGLAAPRRQVLLDIMRGYREIAERSSVLKYLKLENRPDVSRMASALTRIQRAYSFTMEVRGVISGTNEPLVRHVTVSSDSVLTRGEMEESAATAVLSGQERYGIEVTQILPIRAVKAGSLGSFL